MTATALKLQSPPPTHQSRRPLRHGIRSNAIRLDFEDERETNDLIESLNSRFQPRDELEREIVNQILFTLIRLRRLCRASNADHVSTIQHNVENRRYRAVLINHGIATAYDSPEKILSASTADSEDEASQIREVIQKLDDAWEAIEAGTDFTSIELPDDLMDRWDAAKDKTDSTMQHLDRTYEQLGLPVPARGYSYDSIGFQHFIADEITRHNNLISEIQQRETVRAFLQDSSLDPKRHQLFARYEAHLTRQLERLTKQLTNLQTYGECYER